MVTVFWIIFWNLTIQFTHKCIHKQFFSLLGTDFIPLNIIYTLSCITLFFVANKSCTVQSMGKCSFVDIVFKNLICTILNSSQIQKNLYFVDLFFIIVKK